MSWSNALATYVTHPERFEKDGVVLFYDDEVSIIHDGFGKSSFHLLILPRDPQLTKKHPATGLTPHWKNVFETYVEWCSNYIYDHFIAKYDILSLPNSASSQNKNAFITHFIQVGIHSAPSMSNLHIHVLTKDFHSMRLKNKKHYNSFNTRFFISWDQLPLKKVPDKYEMEQNVIKKSDLICCYCGKNFTNKFSQLKQHLEVEFNNHFTAK